MNLSTQKVTNECMGGPFLLGIIMDGFIEDLIIKLILPGKILKVFISLRGKGLSKHEC